MSCEAIIINTKAKEYEKRDKTKGVQYTISIDADGECGTLNTTEEIYKQGLKKYKPCNLVMEYGEYNGRPYIRVVSAMPIE